jgi:hypothetical protein
MRLSIATSVVLLLSINAHAQEAEARSGSAQTANRFQLERTDTGVVRLDTQTGAMTLCRDENGTLACRMQPDERAAYEDELDRLEKRVTALENVSARRRPARFRRTQKSIGRFRSWSGSCASLWVSLASSRISVSLKGRSPIARKSPTCVRLARGLQLSP